VVSWLTLHSYDPAGELIWLAQELLAAEQANQKVHILSHIPGNSDCYKVWAKHYWDIIYRFVKSKRILKLNIPK
jgi:sphingomyelin phosphodiesterase